MGCWHPPGKAQTSHQRPQALRSPGVGASHWGSGSTRRCGETLPGTPQCSLTSPGEVPFPASPSPNASRWAPGMPAAL